MVFGFCHILIQVIKTSLFGKIGKIYFVVLRKIPKIETRPTKDCAWGCESLVNGFIEKVMAGIWIWLLPAPFYYPVRYWCVRILPLVFLILRALLAAVLFKIRSNGPKFRSISSALAVFLFAFHHTRDNILKYNGTKPESAVEI